MLEQILKSKEKLQQSLSFTQGQYEGASSSQHGDWLLPGQHGTLDEDFLHQFYVLFAPRTPETVRGLMPEPRETRPEAPSVGGSNKMPIVLAKSPEAEDLLEDDSLAYSLSQYVSPAHSLAHSPLLSDGDEGVGPSPHDII